MAGGVGTRFWPKGTTKLPKQFLKITHDTESMLQQTIKRLGGLIRIENTFIISNTAYKGLIRKQIPHIPEDNIICEPYGRNTAPCIGLTCLYIKQFNQKANVFVVPSDHIINDIPEFHRIVKIGLQFVKNNGGIVTLGINPTKPETGYGYIQFDSENTTEIDYTDINKEKQSEPVFKVKTFAEKPNIELAKEFIKSGDFLWNSGMFIFRIDTMMNEIKKSLPELHSSLIKLEEKLFTNQFEKELEITYSQLKGISIDYGVMENSNEVFTIKSNFGWNDLGSWDEIYNIEEKDTNNNVIQGRSVIINSKNCLVINDQRITALVDVENLLVIDTDNGLLICKRNSSQDVKEVVDYLKRKGLEQYL